MEMQHIELLLITICVMLNVAAYYWDNPVLNEDD